MALPTEEEYKDIKKINLLSELLGIPVTPVVLEAAEFGALLLMEHITDSLAFRNHQKAEDYSKLVFVNHTEPTRKRK